MITPIFASYIAEYDLEVDNDAIARYCHNMMEIDSGRVVSNKGGWQSNLISSIDEPLKQLCDSILLRVAETNISLGFKDLPISMQRFWININNKGDYNEFHDHAGSFYSAVYYVKAEENQGDIMFYNPMPFYSNYVLNNIVNQYTTCNSTTWQKSPKTGRLYIFPSYLNHCVKENTTENSRISMAFNFTVNSYNYDPAVHTYN